MLKEGISIDERWLHDLSLSHSREAAKGAGSVLRVAQQTHGALRSPLPAGHPQGECFQLPALGYPPGSEDDATVI